MMTMVMTTVTMSVAQQLLREELACQPDEVFENLFGSSTCDGLKTESIEYILNSEQTFRLIFTKEFFREIREALNRQTLHDIEVNLLNKLDACLAGSQAGRAQAAAHFRSCRSVKTPFTFLENNTALVVLVDQFIKKLKKLDISRAAKEARSNVLEALRKELNEFAEIKRWMLPGCRFKKSEIVSFVC